MSLETKCLSDLDLNNNSVINHGGTVADTDAAIKSYVDNSYNEYTIEVGLLANLPTLDVGIMYFATDDNSLWVGTLFCNFKITC